MISDTNWPRHGRVGFCRSGLHAGEYVLLVSEDRDEVWTFYIANPRADESFDNYFQGNNVAQDIIDDWGIEWIVDDQEEKRIEKEVFNLRSHWPK